MVQVMNLRLKKSFGEGSHLNPEKLYYPSVHSLDGVEGFKYARDRVYRDLLDLWLEKKISYAGITFSETDEVLSEEERVRKFGPCFTATVDQQFLHLICPSSDFVETRLIWVRRRRTLKGSSIWTRQKAWTCRSWCGMAASSKFTRTRIASGLTQVVK